MIKKAMGIKYDREEDIAPRVIAKGAGSIAEKIIKIAEEHNIPIYKDLDLVEVLAGVELGREIPPIAYKVIAEILAFVYTMNDKFKVKRGDFING
jgi:flagellar biosynthesis protein